MSSIVVSGDTSGAITIAAPSAAGTNTLTLPALTQTVNVMGPAFYGYANTGTSTGTNSITKLTIDAEVFDTNNNFDTTTSKFTPTVAGYYQINCQVTYAAGATQMFVNLYKNGSSIGIGSQQNIVTYHSHFSTLVSMNGSTDYLEVYWYQNSGGTISNATGQYSTFINGCFLRGA